MRLVLIAAVSFGLLSAPAVAQTPFVFEGHAKAYQAFLATLPPPTRKLSWLTRFDGPSSPARPLKIAGKPVTYIFGCKTHRCDTDNANIFVLPDGAVHTVLKINGVQTLVGGAGAAEVVCVGKLNASGGAAEAC